MNIHFIGIGGIGISGLAQLYQTEGAVISGSNMGADPVTFPILQKSGITNIYDTHSADYITPDLDLVIYTEAILEGNTLATTNPEFLRAQALNIPIKSYFEALGEMSQKFHTIAVAGTHGKTTTTGLIAAALQSADIPFTALVGSRLPVLNENNYYHTPGKLPHLAKPILLVEACEYRANFRFLQPELALVTNLEWDHADAFPTADLYFAAFADFCRSATQTLYRSSDSSLADFLTSLEINTIGVEDRKDLELSIFGTHNHQNASLATGIPDILGIEKNKFESGLQTYTGAGRRQEFLCTRDGIDFYDDYGHHPTEIAATYGAFATRFPKSKIALVFEPHQHSRTREFFDAFMAALSDIPCVGIHPIYAARDTDADKSAVSHLDLVKSIPQAREIGNHRQLAEFIQTTNPDIVLFMGAGVISNFARGFLEI